MAPPRESEPRVRDAEVNEDGAELRVDGSSEGAGDSSPGIRRGITVGNENIVSFEPPKTYVQERVSEAVAHFEHELDARIDTSGMDEGAKRVLYEFSENFAEWPESVRDDALAALQHLQPDNRGTERIGPL